MNKEHRPIIMIHHEVEIFERGCFDRAQKENNLKDMEEIVNSQHKRAITTMI